MRKPLAVVLVVVVAVLIHLGVRYAVNRTDTQQPDVAPAELYPIPQPESNVDLDPQLIGDAGGFREYLSAAEAPTIPGLIPVSDKYWEDDVETIILEPTPVKLLDGAGDIFWHAWTADERIVCATRERVLIFDPASRKTRSIFSGKIGYARISPDRTRLAVSTGNELFLISDAGKVLGRHRITSLDAAWNPSSDRVACTTENSVWLLRPNHAAKRLVRHTYLKNSHAYEQDSEMLKVLSIDSVSWSASGKYIAYLAHAKGEEDWDKPYLIAFDLGKNTRRIVSEGYSESDCRYTWAPVDDWMVITGNYGDVDTGVSLVRAWRDEWFPISSLGPSVSYLDSTWRPYSGSFCVYVRTMYTLEASAVDSLYRIDVTALDSYGRAGHLSESQRQTVATLAERAYSAIVPRADCSIPDFEWSPSGAHYAFVDRLYTSRQWKSAKDAYSLDAVIPGEPICLLRIQRGDGDLHILTAVGQAPENPAFSPDGRQVTYISRNRGQGSLWAVPVETLRALGGEHEKWLKAGKAKRESGDLVEAAKALRNAVRYDSKAPEPHRMLMDVYLEAARRERNPWRKYYFLNAASFEARNIPDEEAVQYANAHLKEISRILGEMKW